MYRYNRLEKAAVYQTSTTLVHRHKTIDKLDLNELFYKDIRITMVTDSSCNHVTMSSSVMSKTILKLVSDNSIKYQVFANLPP